MAASLPAASSSTTQTSSSSNTKTESKPNMAPSTAESVAISSSNSGTIAEATTEATAEALAPKPSLKKRRRDGNSKSKSKLKKKETAQCVGYYIDALDKKMLWGEARIVQCNLTNQKIKVHFVGWSKNYDIWTDIMSITAHGRYASRTNHKSAKSWDGDMRLFEDMLGTIAPSMSTSVPAPTLNKQRVTPVRNIKRPTVIARAKESIKEKHQSSRSSKRQKREEQQPTVSTTAKARPSEAKVSSSIAKASSPTAKTPPSTTKNDADDLPLFRSLELDDGSVFDFSVQRQKARVEREAMQSFLDKCALIWKNQLSALHVH